MKRIFAGLIAVAMLGMASCSHDIPDDTAPYVPIQADYMKIGFDDRSEAVISSLPDVTMYTIFYVYINRPEDYTKIKSLKIIRPDGIYYEYKDDTLMGYWSEERQRFDFVNRYSSSTKTTAPLGTYEVIITEIGGSSTSFKMTAYADHDFTKNSGLLYCEQSGSTPIVLKKPEGITVSKLAGTYKLKFDIASIDAMINYMYVWLYNASNEYIGYYQVAGPLADDQHVNFSAETTLTPVEYDAVSSVVMVFLSEKSIDAYKDGRMMYRYLCWIIPDA